MKHKACESCEEGNHWYRDKLFWIVAVAVVLVAISYVFPFLVPFRNVFFEYIGLIWWAVVLGLLLSGLIGRFIPDEYISKILSGKKKRNVFYSVGLGFLLSACSHGILVISMELYKKGADISSVIAVLMASPWANMTMTVIMFGFFGFLAVYIIVSAIIIAIITGLVYQFLENRGVVEKHKFPVKVKKGFSIRRDARKKISAYKFSFNDIGDVLSESWVVGKMVLWWLLLGIMAASFIGAYIPAEIFHQYLGPSFLGLAITLIVATIIEVCSEGSSPIAFEIFRQTGALGNAFTFLMAGVATDYTEIGLIASNIGRRAAFFLPIITVPQILLLAYLFNVFI